MVDKEKVSVIIPVYNRANMIGRAIVSVQQQSYKNLEIIVVDDGSTDNTKDVVMKFAMIDCRIKYIYQENRGSNFARNNGILAASGVYISMLDSDDEYVGNKIEMNLDFMRKTNADVIFSSYKHIRLDGRCGINPSGYKEGKVTLEEIGRKHGVTTDTIFGKASVFKGLLFDENVIKSQDLDFMLSAARKYNVFFQRKVLAIQYATENSITYNITKKKNKLLNNMEYLITKYMDIPEFIGPYLLLYSKRQILFLGINPIKDIRSSLTVKFSLEGCVLYILSHIGIVISVYTKYIGLKNKIMDLKKSIIKGLL